MQADRLLDRLAHEVERINLAIWYDGVWRGALTAAVVCVAIGWIILAVARRK